MRITATLSMRPVIVAIVVSAAMFTTASLASAQGFGIGARLAWVHADSTADVDAVRFTGGQIRLISPKWGVEVALDHHSESFELLNQKVSETPIQASLMMRLGGGKVAPFVLGGPGWYKRKVEPLNGLEVLNVDNTEFGWHAGVGLEALAGRHFGIHGDYRYTFLDFGKKKDNAGVIGGLLPGHRGSMWTLGATVYF
jgi:hypothetical protein